MSSGVGGGGVVNNKGIDQSEHTHSLISILCYCLIGKYDIRACDKRNFTIMSRSRGGGGDRGLYLPPLKNQKNIGFLRNTRP